MEVKIANIEDKKLVENILQKYLYEMTEYYENNMDEIGNFDYKYLPYYFENKARQIFLAYENQILLGFAFINTHSFTASPVDNCIAEFCIFPSFRKNGKGGEFLEKIFEFRQGSYQLKFSEKNEKGAHFWRKVKEKYNGTLHRIDGEELLLEFFIK